MRLIKLDEKRDLALKAVVYGCNTNKRLAGASFMTGIDSGSPETISFYDALDVIDKMMDDTVEAEPVKHGRWVKDGDFLICLECESEINIKNSLGVENHKNYCPHCGAKMDGGTE